MLVILHGIGLLSTVGLAWFVWAGIKNPWPLVALSFINGGARSSSTPAEQAMLSSVVPGRDLLNAVSLLQANLNGSRLVGPLLAAPLLVVGGGAGAFLVAVLLYGVAIWQVWSMGPVAHERSGAEGNAVAQMAQGVRYAVQTPVVFSLIALVFLHCAFVMGFDAALPQLAADRLGATGKEYSVLVMAIGAGSLIGAFTLAGIARRAHRGNLLFATSILSGLTMAPLAYATSWPAALISAALLGMTQSMFIALATTSLQLATPDRVRGRILALYWGASGGVMGFAALFTGRLADTFGVAPAIAVPGLLFIAVTCLTLLAPTLRTIYGRRAVSVAAAA
jgi:MFS family permease